MSNNENRSKKLLSYEEEIKLFEKILKEDDRWNPVWDKQEQANN